MTNKSPLFRESEELQRTAKLLIKESRELIAQTKALTKKLAAATQQIKTGRAKKRR